MKRVAGNTFDRPWLVLCEGDADKKLIDRLLEIRNVTDREKFHVQFPDRQGREQEAEAYLAHISRPVMILRLRLEKMSRQYLLFQIMTPCQLRHLMKLKRSCWQLTGLVFRMRSGR